MKRKRKTPYEVLAAQAEADFRRITGINKPKKPSELAQLKAQVKYLAFRVKVLNSAKRSLGREVKFLRNEVSNLQLVETFIGKLPTVFNDWITKQHIRNQNENRA